jgi:cellulose 1,4-beta-cellobiosidase
MKVTATAIAAFAAGALAAPPTPVKNTPRGTAAACASAVTLDASTNVWTKYKLHANTYYRAEVMAAVGNLSDTSLTAAATKVADVGSFLWM